MSHKCTKHYQLRIKTCKVLKVVKMENINSLSLLCSFTFWFFHCKKTENFYFQRHGTTIQWDSALCQCIYRSRRLQQGSLGLLNSKYTPVEMRYVYKLQEPLCQQDCWKVALLLSALSLGPLSTLALRKVSWEGEDEWKLGGISFGRTSRGLYQVIIQGSVCSQPGCEPSRC